MAKKNCNNTLTATECGFIPDVKHTGEKETLDYGFYSNVLKKPFERLDDLKHAEYVYFEEQKLKEDKAAQKKADAKNVEETFKTLNAARKEYKENLTQLTKEYAESLSDLQKAFELGKKDLRTTLAAAEENWDKTLKEFTTKYDQYHMTLKGDDFETTISSNADKAEPLSSKTADAYADIFKWIFGL
jgi:chromosome segregation ATPase